MTYPRHYPPGLVRIRRGNGALQEFAMRLWEKYRPKDWSEFVGNKSAVTTLRCIERAGGFAGKFLIVTGIPGCGKSTISDIVSRTIADDWGIRKVLARQLTPSLVAEYSAELRLYAPGANGLTGRALQIEELHGINPAALEALLVATDAGAIPNSGVIVATTTRDGDDKLWAEKNDYDALMHRAERIELTNQGLAQVFAERAAEICRLEGLGAPTVADCVKLARKCNNSMRDMLGEIGRGCFMDLEVAA